MGNSFTKHAIRAVHDGRGVKDLREDARETKPYARKTRPALSLDDAAEKLAAKIENLIDFDRNNGQGNALVQDFRFLEMIKADLSDRDADWVRASIRAAIHRLKWWRAAIQPKKVVVKRAASYQSPKAVRKAIENH